MLQSLKEFQLQRWEDLNTLATIAWEAWDERQLPKLDAVPQSALYTAIVTLAATQLMLVLLTHSGRRAIFTSVDTVLAIVLVVILLVAILSLPVGAVYIGMRGSLMMARSLAENFPALERLFRPLLAALGQLAAPAPADSAPGHHS